MYAEVMKPISILRLKNLVEFGLGKVVMKHLNGLSLIFAINVMKSLLE